MFAPHSTLRAAITPAGRGAGGKGAKQDGEAPAAPKHVAMSWAQHLKQVFGIEIETCAGCQGRLQRHGPRGQAPHGRGFSGDGYP